MKASTRQSFQHRLTECLGCPCEQFCREEYSVKLNVQKCGVMVLKWAELDVVVVYLSDCTIFWVRAVECALKRKSLLPVRPEPGISSSAVQCLNYLAIKQP